VFCATVHITAQCVVVEVDGANAIARSTNSRAVVRKADALSVCRIYRVHELPMYAISRSFPDGLLRSVPAKVGVATK